MVTRNTIKIRYNGIQTLLKHISDGGCLFLSLVSIIEEVTGQVADVFDIIQISMKSKWLTPEFEVNNSIAILETFTDKIWSRIELPALPSEIRENEFTIEKWYNPKTKFTHFRRRFVDTLISSKTVAEGYLKEYYIYSYR
ncbi:MAG: hypothetical protein J6S85_19745 [Methanobrevibacter sp.]|nr:hypothetical protein [Methanobrevibacter sp.]